MRMVASSPGSALRTSVHVLIDGDGGRALGSWSYWSCLSQLSLLMGNIIIREDEDGCVISGVSAAKEPGHHLRLSKSIQSTYVNIISREDEDGRVISGVRAADERSCINRW